jgi:hypothetical protein
MWPSGGALKLRSKLGFGTRLALPITLLALVFVGCDSHSTQPADQATAPTLTGDAAHPGQTSGWVDTKLYFGLGPADDAAKGVSEAAWRAFLDKEVTPRFPDGLSVVDVYGQWQGAKEPSPERLRSKMLIVDYPDTQANRDKVDAIRAAWKKMTGDQSVLRVTQPVDASF